MAELHDITPNHSPVSIAKDMLKEAPKAVAGFYVLLFDDDTLIRQSCGNTKKEVLWALERCKNDLMRED